MWAVQPVAVFKVQTSLFMLHTRSAGASERLRSETVRRPVLQQMISGRHPARSLYIGGKVREGEDSDGLPCGSHSLGSGVGIGRLNT